ncbi:GTP cyclohydrolase II RibA [Krasilnikovia sp. MM14-A1004]|uniref:GTP cyclohydrolase II RibA n=1 Tax=Krasilnikovia sp. MM14-A1004 TaxID=3373541 RepID=UPI00399CC6FF
MSIAILASCNLPTESGDFVLHVFGDPDDGTEEVVALVHGAAGDSAPLVRLHSACFTGDLLGSLRCDCGPQLTEALRLIGNEPYGILLYLMRHEGRGIGLVNKIKAYALQEAGLNTVDANTHLGLPVDSRDYTAAAAALQLLGVDGVRLATNNPLKIEAVRAAGIAVTRVFHGGFVGAHNEEYLRVKDLMMGHLNARGVPAEQIPATER